MANYWRYFRLDGDPHVYGGTNLFTVCIHHGGRFYSRNGVNKVYRGGEIVYVDGVDKGKLSVTGFNYWAHDLGYLGGPVGYWFRIPGSESGTGYLPIVTDADCMDMVQFIPEVGRLIHVYIVCLAGRRYLQDYELDRYDDEVDHLSYFGHTINDLWLEDDAAENVEDEAQDFGTDGEQVQEGSENVEEEVHVDSEDEYMPEEVINMQQQPEMEVQVPENAEVPQVIHQQSQVISENFSDNVTIDVELVTGMQSQTSTNTALQPQPQGASKLVFSGKRFKSPARRIKPGKKPTDGSSSATSSGTNSRKPTWKY